MNHTRVAEDVVDLFRQYLKEDFACKCSELSFYGTKYCIVCKGTQVSPFVFRHSEEVIIRSET